MSYLSEEIKRQIEIANKSQSALSVDSGISQGQISKWVNAEQASINAEQIDALAESLSSDKMDHALLLIAHLQDERIGSARELVRIELNTPLELNDRPRPRTKGEKALQFLIEQRQGNHGVNDLLIDLARVMGAKI